MTSTRINANYFQKNKKYLEISLIENLLASLIFKLDLLKVKVKANDIPFTNIQK